MEDEMIMQRRFIFLLMLLLLGSFLLVGCRSTGTDQKDASNQTGQQTSVKPNKTGNVDTTGKTESPAVQLKEILRLAQQGKIINCEFPVETTVIETVQEKWGDPDQQEYIAAAKGTYTTYIKQQVVFGSNKGSQIFDVRSYNASLQPITMSDVQQTLGTPANIHHYANEDMLVYKAGEKYQLLFLFPKTTQTGTDPQLNHYNVFYPQGSVNSMADDPGLKY
jgi:hypothetical protein